MHKQFQKIGLFINKETDPKLNEKYLKYLYKKETENEKSKKRKIKSANDTDTASKYSHKQSPELKHDHKRRSSGSLGRKHRTKEAAPSETELFFISPEEIKKHRTKLHHSKEKPSEVRESRKKHSEQRNSSHNSGLDKKKISKEEAASKFIKQKLKDSHKEDYQWLTKNEVFKLLNSATGENKNISTGSNFLKKFFVIDKADYPLGKSDFTSANSKQSRKVHGHGEGNTQKHVTPVKTNTKKLETASTGHGKKNRDHSVDVMYSRESRKHHKEKSHDSAKMQKASTESSAPKVPSSSSKKRRSHAEDEKLVFDELKVSKKRDENLKAEPKKVKHSKVQCSQLDNQCIDLISQVKAVIGQTEPKDPSAFIEQLNKKMINISQVNPERHKLCLVKNTFPVVDISASNDAAEDVLEKKQKSKAFKNYYKYNRNSDKDSEITTSTTYHAFSDSHKMYQDVSGNSAGDLHKRPKKMFFQQTPLKLETHVSAVVIDPTHHTPKSARSGYDDDDKKIKKYKTKLHASKIPIPNNSSKIVELATDINPTPRSRKISNDLFAPKHSEDKKQSSCDSELRKNTENDRKIKHRNSLGTKPNDERSTKKENKMFYLEIPAETNKLKSLPPSRPSSARSSVAGENIASRRPSSATCKSKENESFIKSSERKNRSNYSKMDQNESRTNKTSSIVRSNKMNNMEKKPPLGKNSVSTANSAKTNKSRVTDDRTTSRTPSKLSNDGASSVWSKGSKKTNKTTFSSKSDTKIRERKSSPDRKYKTFDRSSTKTSLSNSTCGGKSIGSSKNDSSFLLTKTYKDDEKLSRWQKRKMYSDIVRKNAISRNQKSGIPPQVLEVRYLTVTNVETIRSRTPSVRDNSSQAFTIPDCVCKSQSTEPMESAFTPPKEFYDDDLPHPCFEMIEHQKFQQLFDLPMDKALDDILNENYNFLKKDFSLTVNDFNRSSSSEEDFTNEFSSEKKDNWYDFQMNDTGSLTDLSCYHNDSNNVDDENLNLGSQDHIVDSLSAPGSEESGYATLASRRRSKSFFEKPTIKALFENPVQTFGIDVKKSSSSHCGLEIRSLESKSLQTTVESSQKSVQIKLSKDEIFEMTNFSDRSSKQEEQQEKEKLEVKKEDGRISEEPKKEHQENFATKEEIVEDILEVVDENLEIELTAIVKESNNELSNTTNIARCESYPDSAAISPEHETTNKKKGKKRKTRNTREKLKKLLSFFSCMRCVSSG